MDRKTRHIAITFPVVFAMLVGAVIIYSVLQTSGTSSNAAHAESQAAAADPNVMVENMVCEFDVWVGQVVVDAEKELVKLGRVIRVFGPNTPATMDHRPDRINILHDDNGRIVQVTCG